MKRFILRLMLLLAFVGNAGAAPIYQVSVNTAALSGFSGYLDFLFLGLATATPAQATVSNLAGDFTGADQVFGDVSGTAATGFVIGNSTGWNELALGANFGGLFTFDVEFEHGAAFRRRHHPQRRPAGQCLQLPRHSGGHRHLRPAARLRDRGGSG
ncbi:NF038129 family PEP-CTERM protein [Pseudoduganella sp. UC29_106]|uniref:NF038129 family PEP-CTERM protein n=1 Tax=Pseudoduganella sp. UC29_106 TaxID=3374553 RepID=UPI0037569DC5